MHLSFTAEKPGVVYLRELADQVRRKSLSRCCMTVGSPFQILSFQIPLVNKGISLNRQWYLFGKVCHLLPWKDCQLSVSKATEEKPNAGVCQPGPAGNASAAAGQSKIAHPTCSHCKQAGCRKSTLNFPQVLLANPSCIQDVCAICLQICDVKVLALFLTNKQCCSSILNVRPYRKRPLFLFSMCIISWVAHHLFSHHKASQNCKICLHQKSVMHCTTDLFSTNRKNSLDGNKRDTPLLQFCSDEKHVLSFVRPYTVAYW